MACIYRGIERMRIETERLILRPIDAERDFEAWACCMADAETMRFIGGSVLSRPLAWRNMAAVMGHWQIRGYGFFSVERKDTGEWIGRVGPWNPEGWPEPEVGWAISREYWGQGFATEAARASVDFAFDTLGWKRVIHVILDGNDRSVAVAERVGSRFEKRLPHLPGVTEEEVLVYAQER